MRIADSRRVTGSNLATRASGVVIDAIFETPGTDDAERIVAAWRRAIARVLPWPGELHVRHFDRGVSLFVSGPVEVLMPLTELNEWALASAEAEVAGGEPPELDPDILARIEQARVPGLADLTRAAREHGLPVLVDDEAITIGAGPHQLRFARLGPLPSVAEVDWSRLSRIPIGIVTGTNGKTTTTRLVARMARAAGLVPGITSSDGVAIDEVLIHPGDFSGPEGSRIVLRDPRVEIAVLETARGGILRRGLTVERCDAAVITNVSGDHLGDYGVDDVTTMARVKAVVGRDARTVILNADDPALVAIAPSFDGNVVWFAHEPRAGIASPSELGRAALPEGVRRSIDWTVRDGQLVHHDQALIAIADIPITFGGRATYNVENALAAAALAHALGIADAAIVQGLRDFTSSREDNPGRGNLADVAGVTVVLDFGHNPAAIRAVVGFARALLAERGRGALHVTIGMPGDRLDAELHDVAGAIAAGGPAQVIVRELPELLRGRAPGAVPELLAAGLRDHGVAAAAIGLSATELDAVERALAGARAGDVVLVLTHLDPAVDALVARASTA